MQIIDVNIRNYKSIKEISFKPSPKLNVFIGENSVGKSNILEAIYSLLGPKYPTFNAVMTQDHYKGQLENKINISLKFDDGHTLSLAEEWYGGYKYEKKSGLSRDNNYINSEDRQEYCSAYLDIRRNISDYLPSNRWSLLGRFLLDINKLFMREKASDGQTLKSEILKKELTTIRDELLFTVKDQNGIEILPEFLKIVQTECARQLNRKSDEFNFDMNIYDPWNFYKTLQILVTDSDAGLDFQASEMGMGVQASLSIAILKAYSKLKLANNTPIFIDEPELFLHPQAQRNFYKILTELADSGTQIFLTTHSPSFINLSRFNEIYVVRKSFETGTYIRNANPDDFVSDLKIRTNISSDIDQLMEKYNYAYDNTGDTQKANEAFFAKKVILVEGESESLILPYFFKLLNFDYVAENISIVRCGGKSELDRFYRLYSEFGIPCFILFDGDMQNAKSGKNKRDIEANKKILEIFGCSDEYPSDLVTENYLGFQNCLEYNLNICPIPQKKGLELYYCVKDKIDCKEKVPKWVNEMIKALMNLPYQAESILKR